MDGCLVAKAQTFLGHGEPVMSFGKERVELDRLAEVRGGGFPISGLLAGDAAKEPGLRFAVGRWRRSPQQVKKTLLLACFQERSEIVAPGADIIGPALETDLEMALGHGAVAAVQPCARQGEKSVPIVGRGGDVASEYTIDSLGETRSSSARIRIDQPGQLSDAGARS